MTVRAVRENGFPNNVRIFGEGGSQIGVDVPASAPDSFAPLPYDPDAGGRPHRREFLRSAAVGAGVAALTGSIGSPRARAQDTARTKSGSRKNAVTGVGLMLPGTEEFEAVALDIMKDGDCPAAQLCVSKDGKIIFNRAYGMLDPQKRTRLPVNARIRLASLDKIITSTAIHQLIDARTPIRSTGDRMSLDLRPFRTFAKMGIKPPAGKQTDPRLVDVTVKHLLEHSAGLDQDVHNYRTLQQELGLTTLPTATDAMRYHFCKKLAFDPGSKSSYKSAGYMVLRFLVELAGGSFIGYLKKNVFGPAGTANVCLTHTRPAQRDPLEVRYQCPETGPSVFPEDKSKVLPTLDGGADWYDYHLILAASAEAVVRYLSYWYFAEAWRLWVDEPGRLAPGLNNGAGVFAGGMTGIRTMMNQRRWTMCNYTWLSNWVRTHPGVKEQNVNDRIEAVWKNLGW